jgi:hypothetical protein
VEGSQGERFANAIPELVFRLFDFIRPIKTNTVYAKTNQYLLFVFEFPNSELVIQRLAWICLVIVL